MKANISSLSSGYNTPLNRCKNAALLAVLILVLAAISRFDRHHLPDDLPFLSWFWDTNVNTSVLVDQDTELSYSTLSDDAIDSDGNAMSRGSEPKCDIFRGTWVPDSEGRPYYGNKGGCEISEGEDCMKFGRPDSEYMKWRWRPDGCELPRFDAAAFLELVRGKSMAFIGDSLARNHMQSLGCMLSAVARPVNQSDPEDQRLRRWFYADYNFTLQLMSSTHLITSRSVEILSVKPIHLYLDEADEIWATRVESFDYLIISAGHWFSRPLIYHENQKITGCHMCRHRNTTELTRFYGYRQAFQTVFSKLLDLRSFKGTVFLRTISPTHFEVEQMEGRGNCARTRPFTKRELKFDWYLSMYYVTEVELLKEAQREVKGRELKLRLLDVTEAMRLRPDGHPNVYGQSPEKKKSSADCLHWCLPGAIDTWNELLLQMLKTDR
ncbi:protein trichome birefringence-like 19 [Diospyros lotus]|uniref:protein trichome birefringence-like 19 n=1 Tax=Diospyros lotus TaxID=55363 RepID=UPI002255C9E7|nr:protein trichome birefringence-like 19 [Diospyros lotus]